MRFVTPVMLYTKVDAQCDKLATVVGGTKLTAFATINVPGKESRRSVEVSEFLIRLLNTAALCTSILAQCMISRG